MAPLLYHGLNVRNVPVVCIESRLAHQALKALATHKTDRKDARGLAQLARTGFFKPVHIESLLAHAIRALIGACKKLVPGGVPLSRSSANTCHSVAWPEFPSQVGIGHCNRGADAP
jgi:transposase